MVRALNSPDEDEDKTALPPLTAPVVLIALDPLSMLPKPLVILPLFSAPVVTMLESPAAGAAPMSDSTSDADRPSTFAPSTRRKSLSATPAVACKMLFSEMPVVIDAAELAADVAELAASVAELAAAVADDAAFDA